MFPIAALVLLGMAAMAIDGGRLFLGQRELQNAAEAAALDGALTTALLYPDDPDPASHKNDVLAAVNDSVARNLGIVATVCQLPVTIDAPKYQGETVQGTNVNAVYVHLSCRAQFVAAAIIPGVLPLSIAADAEAVLGSSDLPEDKPFRLFLPYRANQPDRPSYPYPRVLPVRTETS